MKKIRYILILLSSILLIVSITAYSKKSNDTNKYSFGVIHSSDSSSNISIYNENGDYLSDKNLKYGGITLASFIKFGIENNNRIYYASPVSKGNVNNFILEINKNNLKITEIKSDDIITPTFFCVDDKFAYSGVSTLTQTYFSKTDINSNKVVNSIELTGQGIFSLEDNYKIYVLSIIHDDKPKPYAKIHIVNKSDFKVSKNIELPSMTFITDAKIIDNNMYLLINRDGNDNLSNQMLKINLNNNDIEKFDLPFNNLYQLHIYDDNIYVTEYNYHDEKTENRIAKINLKTKEIVSFKIGKKQIISYIKDYKYIFSDGNNIYIYDINNFKLIDKYKVKKIKNKEFVSFYIN